MIWPLDTGGFGTLEKVVARCREIQKIPREQRPRSFDENVGFVDPVLSALLAPERRRLLDMMVTTMRRLRQVVYG